MDGIVNFYKPEGMTSHDAVNFFRKLLNIRRIGHTGTLDPNAKGVLPICIGKATRISEYILEADKEYIGVLVLGCETDTQDSDGRILNSSDKIVDRDSIIESFQKFKGNIEQVPPMYSALKHKGKRLYELAREGKVVQREPRDVKIYDLKIIDIHENREIEFYVRCSRGTYIRTLCHDIGMDLETYGYMSRLIRVGVGDFKIQDSLKMEYLKQLNQEEMNNIILPIDRALRAMDKIILLDNLYNKIKNGMMVPVSDENFIGANGNLRVYCKSEFIGIGHLVCRGKSRFLKMDKVFA